MLVKEVKNKDNVTRNLYRCDWCGYEFEFNAKKGQEGRASDQVVCKKCKRFIKTWV